jgi:hypothetical protein
MLSNTLVTNEIKDRTGTEVEFGRLSISGRSTEFAAVAETPQYPHRLKISHQESGVGLARRRRSVVRIDKTILSTDTVTPVTVSAYIVLDTPVGALANGNEEANAIAEVVSFCASLGASTTILYDGTGNGATTLISGGL